LYTTREWSPGIHIELAVICVSLFCVGRQLGKQSTPTNTYEQVNKQKRKQVLETLSDILEKKRKCINANEAMSADGAVSASSAMPDVQLSLSVTRNSSAPCSRNSEDCKNEVTCVADEPDLHSKANMSCKRASCVKPGRNSTLFNQLPYREVENNRQRKPGKKQALLSCCPSASKHRLQPVVSRSRKRQLSTSDKSLLGRYIVSTNRNEREVQATEEVAAPTAVQHTNTVVTACERETQKSYDEQNDYSDSKSNREQICAQRVELESDKINSAVSIGRESEGTLLQLDVDKPSSVMTELEHFIDDEEPLALSPPRKVILKFRAGGIGGGDTATDTTRQVKMPVLKFRGLGGGSDMSTATTGHVIVPVTDIKSSVNRPRNSSSPALNSKLRQQFLGNGGNKLKHRKLDKESPLIGHSPVVATYPAQPSVSHSVKRKLPDNDKTNVSNSSRKPLLNLPCGEYAEYDRNYYRRSRDHSSDHRICTHSPAKTFAERSEWLKNGDSSFEYPQFDRGTGFMNEPSWQQRHELSWQHRHDRPWIKTEREYASRWEGSFPAAERITDLRQKLNYCRSSSLQCQDKDLREAHRPSSFDDQHINHVDNSQQCLLPPAHHHPHYNVNGDEPCMGDVLQRGNYSDRPGDFSCRKYDCVSVRRDDTWMMNDVDYRCWRPSWERNTLPDHREYQHDWNREVSHYSHL